MRRLIAVTLLAVLLAPALAAAGSAPPDLRVMSFNLRYGAADDGDDAWSHRQELLVDVVREFGPDILGTQECLDFQRDYLLQSLPGYAVVAAGRDDGAEAGEMCAVFVRAERFSVNAAGHFWLSETPDVVASRGWDAALCRMATWLRLTDIAAGGRQFLVVNTHWDHIGVEARRQSALLLRREAAALAQGLPVVIMGDFNTALEAIGPAEAGRLLREGAGDDGLPVLVDSYAVTAGAATAGTFHGFTGQGGRGRIDGILVTPGIAVLSAAIVTTSRGDRYPSDHVPVTAVLRLDKE